MVGAQQGVGVPIGTEADPDEYVPVVAVVLGAVRVVHDPHPVGPMVHPPSAKPTSRVTTGTRYRFIAARRTAPRCSSTSTCFVGINQQWHRYMPMGR